LTDTFLVKAKANNVEGISEAGVEQVLDYFCGLKPCAVPLKPLELPVQGMGVVSVAVGEEVADAVERFAVASRAAGHSLDLAGVGQIAARLCSFKECFRPVSLPPAMVEVQGVGTVRVPFGEEPADAVERFAAEIYAATGALLATADANAILAQLCRQAACKVTTLAPVSVDVGGVGACEVGIGQEPSDAARR